MLLAFCVALQVGFSLPAAGWAALVYVPTAAVGLWASGVDLPRLPSVGAQALACSALTVGLSAITGWGPLEAVTAMATNLMLLVPLPQVVSAVVDAVDSHALAAGVRATSAVMALGGVGIAIAATVALARGAWSPGGVDPSLPVLPVVGVLCFSLLGAVGNALANAGGADLLLPAAGIGLGTAAVNLALSRGLGAPSVWAAGLTAAFLGLAAALLAQRFAHSATALALVGLTGALLPGLVVYQGIYSETLASGSGLVFLGRAAATVAVLGVGTSCGFVVAKAALGRRRRRV